MERETIFYRGKNYHRYPNSKRRQLRVYFWRHDKWKEPPVALHRQIWIDNFGEIPKGFIIHHEDSNPLNNELANLKLLRAGEHNRQHMLEPEQRKRSSENGKKQAPNMLKALAEWRKNNPEKAHQLAIANGLKYGREGACKRWRKEKEKSI